MRVKVRERAAAALALLLLAAAAAGGCARASRDSRNGGGGAPGALTLEQKVGQLLLVGFEGTEVTPEIERLFREVHPGGVILFGRNITGESQLKEFVARLQGLSRADSGLPLFIAVDQEGGEVTRLGWLGDSVSQAQVKDPGQAYRLALARSQGLAAAGINLNLAPVLDMGVQGDFLTRYHRTFSGSPEKVGELAKSAIQGHRDGGLITIVKHFPGYGGITYDPENDRLAAVSSLPEYSQFRVAAEARTDFVMTANVIYRELDPELPFTLSPACIALLREEVEGDYLVMSDDLASKVLKESYGLGNTAVRACRAGVDMLLVSGYEKGDVEAAFNALLEAVRSGDIASGELDARVGGILRLKRGLK